MITLLPETVSQLAEDASLKLNPQISYEALETLLAQQLEIMISNNFQQFVLLLYKIDVAEQKVRDVLAADLSPEVYRKIAAMLIERQQEKIISRKTHSKPPANDGEEKW
ncbi:hypothetical protein [Chitinophaga tropicalis]|uniref:Uncharacterized protein n=1 Tax=Chitinophaga tropicalis TaxID=2683588 RepID=A0A7K1TXS4_9BACT|nr:hypothetical protein [Chitinophaga tropicalis]MVT06901.1 hypothetical protein [Chitinophaga tropicalis]